MIKVFLSLLLSFSVWAGDEVGNGGGLAENNIFAAYENLKEFISFCLQEDCVDAADKLLLESVLAALPEEYANREQIQFKDFRQTAWPQDRLAWTWSSVGSQIYFNTNFLYNLRQGGGKEAISIKTSLSMLIHELGHHHGVTDENRLNRLGSKLAAANSANINTATLRRFANISGILISQGEEFVRLMLSDGEHMYKVRGFTALSKYCGQLPGWKATVKSFGLYNLRWRGNNTSQPFLQLNAELACQLIHDDGIEPARDVIINYYEFKVRPMGYLWDGEKYLIDKTKIAVEAENCRLPGSDCTGQELTKGELR